MSFSFLVYFSLWTHIRWIIWYDFPFAWQFFLAFLITHTYLWRIFLAFVFGREFNFSGYLIVSWQFFFYMLQRCYCIVFSLASFLMRNLMLSYSFFCMYMTCHLSLPLFKVFSLSLILNNFRMAWLDVVFFFL